MKEISRANPKSQFGKTPDTKGRAARNKARQAPVRLTGSPAAFNATVIDCYDLRFSIVFHGMAWHGMTVWTAKRLLKTRRKNF